MSTCQLTTDSSLWHLHGRCSFLSCQLSIARRSSDIPSGHMKCVLYILQPCSTGCMAAGLSGVLLQDVASWLQSSWSPLRHLHYGSAYSQPPLSTCMTCQANNRAGLTSSSQERFGAAFPQVFGSTLVEVCTLVHRANFVWLDASWRLLCVL